MPLGPDKKKRIEDVIKKRTEAIEIGVKHDLYQTPASENQIYELRKHGERYFVYNRVSNTMHTPHGVYIFVIRTWEPGKVYCAPIGKIGGHTSMTRDKSLNVGRVFFAGELLFQNGGLICWNNGSGHYRPEAVLAQKNLLPFVSLILPKHLFKPTNIGRVLGYENAE
ncbi:TPA: hypothetical protein J1487_004916 [Escherichia coli]|nr:hypothetical protein [Escherichia coli]HBA9842758.1 hypothetical protein [Escherichia coli]